MEPLLITIITIQLLVGASLLLSIFSSFRIWPPPGTWTWQFFFTWGSAGFSAIGFVILGIAHFQGFGLHSLAGGVIFLVGERLRYKSIKTLSLPTTVGLKGNLITDGPYKWSRNPMYIADIMNIFGAALFFNTTYTWIIFVPWCCWFLLAPFAEEPWLKKQYGEEYENYAKKTPRFFIHPSHKTV